MNNPAASGRGIKFFFTRNLLTPQSDGVFTLLIQIKTQEENGGGGGGRGRVWVFFFF
jgi:hypothetical protein